MYGGTWPAITWQQFMSKALAGVPVTPFTQAARSSPRRPAAALQAKPTTTTTLPIEAGSRQPAEWDAARRPYVDPTPTPVAPEPVTHDRAAYHHGPGADHDDAPPPASRNPGGTLPPPPDRPQRPRAGRAVAAAAAATRSPAAARSVTAPAGLESAGRTSIRVVLCPSPWWTPRSAPRREVQSARSIPRDASQAVARNRTWSATSGPAPSTASTTTQSLGRRRGIRLGCQVPTGPTGGSTGSGRASSR